MIGIKPTIAFSLVALTFAGAAWLRAEERLRAGLWEVSMVYNGKPAGGVRTTCYTPAMVETGNLPAKMMREATEKALTKTGNCTLKDFRLDGNKLSTTTICGAQSLVTSSTYSGDAFETVNTSTEAGASTVTHIKGRRVGDCK